MYSMSTYSNNTISIPLFIRKQAGGCLRCCVGKRGWPLAIMKRLVGKDPYKNMERTKNMFHVKDGLQVVPFSTSYKLTRWKEDASQHQLVFRGLQLSGDNAPLIAPLAPYSYIHRSNTPVFWFSSVFITFCAIQFFND